MADIIQIMQWMAPLVVFAGMGALQWRLIGALDSALARSQGTPGASDAAKYEIQPITPKVINNEVVPAAPKPTPAAAPAVVIDQGLIDFVKKEEGFKAKAYGDYKQYSIGYGTKASSPDEVITEPEAYQRLIAELQIAQAQVEKFAPNAPLGVKQALTDLTFNAGPIWEQQGLGERIKAGDWQGAKSHLLQYNHAGGQVDAGLTTRREAEVSWFDHPL